MSDFHNIRSRRRIPEPNSYSTVDFDYDPDQKNHKPAGPGGIAYSSFSTVFNASASQLWNSAQEALASSYDTAEGQEAVDADRLKVAETLESLTIFGSPLDHIIITMPSRDRTSEFRATAKSYEMKAAANGVRPHPKHEMLAESVQFNQLAKRIGRELSQTCAKMEKLAEFAKKRSLYEERSQIDHLSSIVKTDITGLNKQIAALQDFQEDVLEITETMKAEKNRRDKFSNNTPLPMGLPSSSSGANVRSKLLQDDEQHGSSSIALDMGALDNFQSQKTMQQRDTSLEYAQARSNTMATIEGSISELGQIFSQLASLVSEQGEMITRIDSNVEDTALNIDMAHSELVRYLQNISKNRWLMIQVFGVLMVFFVVFVLFLT
ncbi:Protein CBR-SYX-5 [Caenorhabditis briggsae]|uniref:Protein CBR-SYX-5 n=1 Tax=Caenorhabditis briggsae TaxID=6238 RepID=A8Y4B1_CAEBR|nr:Protein CBR-SYX-5 [Caenorhabditis briggsae]CAP39731.2 Protein CBR-SYX-5 [Caenorhabditis briggsae]